MLAETLIDYHMRRARDELDLAYRAECRAAMEAHMRLSALHMHCLRDRTAKAASEARPPVW